MCFLIQNELGTIHSAFDMYFQRRLPCLIQYASGAGLLRQDHHQTDRPCSTWHLPQPRESSPEWSRYRSPMYLFESGQLMRASVPYLRRLGCAVRIEQWVNLTVWRAYCQHRFWGHGGSKDDNGLTGVCRRWATSGRTQPTSTSKHLRNRYRESPYLQVLPAYELH